MADKITELLVTDAAADKIGARGVAVEETQQLLDNRYVILHNPRHGGARVRQPRARRFLIGRTNGGRTLTLVVERTVDPTTWLLVTGWEATAAERTILGR